MAAAGWGILVQAAAASPVLVFPQIVGGGGFATEIVMTNPGRFPATGTLRFYNPSGVEEAFSIDGVPQSQAEFSIAPGGAMKLKLDDTGAVKSGWVAVEAVTGGADLSGSLIYRYQGSEVSVPATALGTAFHVFAERNGSGRTAVAVVNAETEEAVLSAEVRDSGGFLVASGPIPVGGNLQLARFVDELFPELPSEFLGSVHFRSEGPAFGAIGLRQKFDGVLAALGGSSKAYAEGTLFATDPVVGSLMKIPAGTFTQGSPNSEPCRWTDEAQFTHTLTRDLAVMQTEVTQRMWADLKTARGAAFDLADPSSHRSNPNLPVEEVTWHEAVLFANELSADRGLTRVYFRDAALTEPIDKSNYVTDAVFADWTASGYRLPTEGEWEHFTRAETTGPFFVEEPAYSAANCSQGSCVAETLIQLEAAAWFCANSGGQTHIVAQKAGNEWGLKDVHGNVWEWIWDWYAAYPQGERVDYRGAPGDERRVVRGGSSSQVARFVRSAYRDFAVPSDRSPYGGFRLVRSVE